MCGVQVKSSFTSRKRGAEKVSAIIKVGGTKGFEVVLTQETYVLAEGGSKMFLPLLKERWVQKALP